MLILYVDKLQIKCATILFKGMIIILKLLRMYEHEIRYKFIFKHVHRNKYYNIYQLSALFLWSATNISLLKWIPFASLYKTFTFINLKFFILSNLCFFFLFKILITQF